MLNENHLHFKVSSLRSIHLLKGYRYNDACFSYPLFILEFFVCFCMEVEGIFLTVHCNSTLEKQATLYIIITLIIIMHDCEYTD